MFHVVVLLPGRCLFVVRRTTVKMTELAMPIRWRMSLDAFVHRVKFARFSLGSFISLCKNVLKGFAGERCQYSLDECQSSPCPQHSKCLDQPNGYRCVCGRDRKASSITLDKECSLLFSCVLLKNRVGRVVTVHKILMNVKQWNLAKQHEIVLIKQVHTNVNVWRISLDKIAKW
jgi:hypothetical protein